MGDGGGGGGGGGGNPIWILEREEDDEVETFETAAERQVNTLIRNSDQLFQ